MAFRLAMCLVFLRFSMLHQVQQYVLHVNLHLLYLVAVPAILALALTGGIRRSFRGRPTIYWLGFTCWMMLAVPFSLWRGNSFSILIEYVRTNLVMLFVIAGLTVTWSECASMMRVIGLAAMANLFTARFFQGDAYGSRLSLGVGTIADPNDFAAHLLLVLPFALWIVFNARSVFVRGVMLLGIAMGVFLILRTESRGALVGIAVAVLFFLVRGSMKQRLALMLLAPIAAAALVVSIPKSAWNRLLSFSSDSNGPDEAIESTESRQYLLRKSILYTFEHPLLGVGPGEFPEYEGTNNRLPGMTHGYWHDTHNTFTEVSSECGIPAALFFIAGIFSTFRLLNSTWKQARKREDCRDIASAAFCAMLGYAGFCAAITFLNFAYFFYFPAMGGLAISISCAAKKEFESRGRRTLRGHVLDSKGQPLAPVHAVI